MMQIAEILFGPHCPFCNCRAWPRFHDCPVVGKMKPSEAVKTIADKVREILRDEPADKAVHGVLEAMDDLEEKYRN